MRVSLNGCRSSRPKSCKFVGRVGRGHRRLAANPGCGCADLPPLSAHKRTDFRRSPEVQRRRREPSAQTNLEQSQGLPRGGPDLLRPGDSGKLLLFIVAGKVGVRAEIHRLANQRIARGEGLQCQRSFRP